MQNEDIVITARTEAGDQAWGFAVSKTEQLDYCGTVDPSSVADWQRLEPSPYFSPSWYGFLPALLRAELAVFVKDIAVLRNADIFSYCMHIGAVLLAVWAKDGLLVAELLDRRRAVFCNYASLTRYLIQSVSVEALFAWEYGRTDGCSDSFLNACQTGVFDDGTGAQLLKAAWQQLNPHNSHESPEKLFIRYFKEHAAAGLSFTIGIVGSDYHGWNGAFDFYESVMDRLVGEDLVNGTKHVREAKNRIFASLRVCMQVEPYNPHDSNAIGVSLEDINGIACSAPGLQRAGYIRATGAAILREAFPDRFSWHATLARLGNNEDGRNGVVLRVDV